MIKIDWFAAFLSLKRGESKFKDCYGILQMPLKVIIFDLDGTLIDSAPDLRTACNKLLATYQRRPITMEETKKFVGNGAVKLVERAFAATGTPVQEQEIAELTDGFLAFYAGHEADETQPYPGVMALLDQLVGQGYRLALCTNKPKAPTENLLRDLGMSGFFELVLGGDELARKKPDPQMIHYVLEEMRVSAEEAIMVGDSSNDIDAARNAGVPSIAVSYGYRKVPVNELEADYIVDHFADLTGILDLF